MKDQGEEFGDRESQRSCDLGIGSAKFVSRPFARIADEAEAFSTGIMGALPCRARSAGIRRLFRSPFGETANRTPLGLFHRKTAAASSRRGLK
ncbi:hypothetical protein BOO69_07385 [Sulfitobacter alexandrii]|uniref:Uncharacterized protein n=1 Tax=Sulfitobacter alexandrii TaxID=1917485 RepID=A0A1J0WG29_9RHOB|nr:hypothetical protein BOO69_07385 [Sulfitobacter alexandrii]